MTQDQQSELEAIAEIYGRLSDEDRRRIAKARGYDPFEFSDDPETQSFTLAGDDFVMRMSEFQTP